MNETQEPIEALSEKEIDASLVLRAREGDQAAYHELYKKYDRYVFTIAYGRLGNRHDAEEQVQEVFLQAFTKLHQLREPGVFRWWLRTMADRLSINTATRKTKRRPLSSELLDDLHEDPSAVDPADVQVHHETRAQLREAFENVDDMHKRTLRYFYNDRMSILDIAAEEDAPDGTINRRLHVGRHRLREQCEALGLTASDVE